MSLFLDLAAPLPQANEKGIGLMDRITARLMKEQAWDQVWNLGWGMEVWTDECP